MAEAETDKEDTGDWRLFLMDMGAIPPQPGYMQPVTPHSHLTAPTTFKCDQDINVRNL